MRPSLQARFEARCEQEPDARALGFARSDGSLRWRSRRVLREEAREVASVLVERGLGPGEVCMLVLPPEEYAHIVLLGCLLAGGVPVLVAPPVLRGRHSNLAEVIRSVARRSGARVIVSDGGVGIAGIDGAEATEVTTAELKDHAGDPATVFLPKPDAVAALQLTSGTTGFPRICVWRQDRVLAGLDGMEAAMGLGPGEVCVNWTPLYHDMGLVNNFLLCLTAGVPLAVIETTSFLRNPAVWLRAMASSGATTTWSPNFGFAYASSRVSDRDLEGVRLDGMRAFWNAAERIHLRTMRDFHRRFEPYGVEWSALKSNFGCAENVGGATFSDPDGAFVFECLDPEALHEEGVAAPVPEGTPGALSVVGVGRPYPGMRIRIVDDEGRTLPDGRVGKILLHTPSRMSGYLADEEATREALPGDWLFTGDLGYARGEELFWTGRVRERINVRGRKYDPSDFEKILFPIPGVREGCFAAFGADDPDLGTERLVILTEVREDGAETTDRILREIRKGVLDRMGLHVDEIHLLPRGAMTKTSSGKRRHRFYRRLYLRGDVEPLASWRAKRGST